MRHAAFVLGPLLLLPGCAPPRPTAEIPAAVATLAPPRGPVPEPPAPAPTADAQAPSEVTPFDSVPALPPHAAGWRVRDCKAVEGFAQIALTFDGGRTLVESREAMDPNAAEVDGIVPIEPKGTLLAFTGHNTRAQPLYISRDAGCRWQKLGTGPNHVTRYAGSGSVAYAWGTAQAVRVTEAGVEQLSAAPKGIRAIVVDATDERHVRATSGDGTFVTSDGGHTWSSVADVPPRITRSPAAGLRVLQQPNARVLVAIGGRNELVTFDLSTHGRTARPVNLTHGEDVEVTAGTATPGDAGGLVLGLGDPQLADANGP